MLQPIEAPQLNKRLKFVEVKALRKGKFNTVVKVLQKQNMDWVVVDENDNQMLLVIAG